MKMIRTLTLCALAALAAFAPQKTVAQHRASVEWGVLGGLNFSNFSTNDSSFEVKNKLGFQAGITIALKFGMFAIEPQVLYARHTFEMAHADFGKMKIKSNSIDVPVLFSIRMLRPLRINIGPVFTVMNSSKYKDGNTLYDCGRVRPTMGYTVGLGLKLPGGLLIDARYNGQFTSKKTASYADSDMKLDLKSYAFAVSLGFVF